MKKSACFAALLLAASASASMHADAAPVIDSRVRVLFSYRERTGETAPLFRRARNFEETGMAPLLVRFEREPSTDELARYLQLGFERGRTLSSGAAKVRASAAALAQMESDGVLAHVSVDLAPAFVIAPADLARDELRISAGNAAWQRLHGAALTGQGVVVGDMDSGVDVFHPAFFKPLAPEAWTDVDGDGVLTPGIDGIDRDQSGAVEPHEVLRHLDGVASNLFQSADRIYGTENPGFDPGWDYLYLDLDGNGKRDAGFAVEGAEQLPSLGEPLFAGDDVDQNGTLALPEKLVPLGESKFRAVEQAGVIYRRGENLAMFPVTSDSGHGTRTMGSVAGGQRGLSRFLGMAPEAELLHTDTHSDATPSLTDNLQWLVDEGVHVVVTELSSFGTVPADGSTELELLIDAVVQNQGVVVVSPAGNLGLSHKHARGTIPSASAPAPYQNEIALEDSPGVLAFSVTWPDGQISLSGALQTADGDLVDLSSEGVGATQSGRLYSVSAGVTLKGAGYLVVAIDTKGKPLPASGNPIELRTTTSASTAAVFYSIDDVSGWAGGAGFAESTVEGCMNAPAFAEKTIAVSAYALHVGAPFSPYPEDFGQFRAFSGRGPDLWGDPGIDIAVADNPVVAAPDSYTGGIGEGLITHWSEFGGTSGAGAVGAGLAALVKQANPELSGEALRDKILEGARVDAEVSAGSPALWGAGKLTLGVGEAPGTAPTATLKAPATMAPGLAIDLTVELVDDGDTAAARTRWDFGYDGVWDTDWQDGLSTSVAMPEGVDHFDVKVEAMDADGWIAPAVVRVGLGDPPPPSASDDDGPAGDDGCGCRTAGNPKTPSPALLLLSLSALALTARRRRERQQQQP